jgi:hypothetical protein
LEVEVSRFFSAFIHKPISIHGVEGRLEEIVVEAYIFQLIVRFQLTPKLLEK